MSRRAVAIGVVFAWAALAGGAAENPRDVGLVERASTRLAQIDVTVTGAKGAIEGLTTADFEVRLNDRIVGNVLVDDLCVAQPIAPEAAPAAAPAESAVAPPPTAPAPRATMATYLFYFDMGHLTQLGRQGSISSAREMLPKLLAGGQKAMIVANASQLKTVVPLTADLARLDAALAKMIGDQGTFDAYTATEDSRLADVIHELPRGVDFALALARRYAAEERWRQERDLRRLSMVLGRFAEIDPPKAVLYFSDSMRQNAGEHYLSFFSGTTLTDPNGKPGADASAILLDAATGALPLDRVINEAAALGIRFYTIEGQGMSGPNSFIQSQSSATGGGGGEAATKPRRFSMRSGCATRKTRWCRSPQKPGVARS